MDRNEFYFDKEHRVQLIKPQQVLGFTNIIYLLAATILQYCDANTLSWNHEKYREGTYHWHSGIPNGIDKQIEKYTNWCDGCALNNTLYTAAKFLYDLQESIVKSKNKMALYLMFGEFSYTGRPIDGMVDKRSLEIIPDALECYAEYVRQQEEHSQENNFHRFDWCEHNEKYRDLFNLNEPAN